MPPDTIIRAITRQSYDWPKLFDCTRSILAIIDSDFLHLGFAHLLFNMFATVLFAPALERILGKIKFIVLFLGAGIIANIAGFYLESPMFTHLGASGAIFGLFGVYIYIVLFRKDLIDRTSSQMIIMILIFSLIMTFLTPNVDIIGHLFGFIGGLVLAPPLLTRVPTNYAWRPIYVEVTTTSYHDDKEPTFNPNRWRGRKFRGDTGKKVLWIVLGIFIAAGILSWLFQTF